MQGDFGPSFRYSDYTVAELVRGAMPVSVRLGILAMMLALIAGVAAGLLAALRRNTVTDRIVSAIAMTGVSIPVIVIGPLLVLFFAVQLGWLPAGWSGGRGAARWVMPVIALALPQIAFIARITRSSMIEVLESEFIRTAKAQGLATATIIRYHAIKPAMLPLLSYLGPAIVGIVTGAIVVLMSPIDYSLVESHRLTGAVLEWRRARLFSPFINSYAAIFLIGGAVLSAWRYRLDPASRHRFVGNDQPGSERQRAGDRDPLPLAAGELVRIAAHPVRGLSDLADHPLGPCALPSTPPPHLDEQPNRVVR